MQPHQNKTKTFVQSTLLILWFVILGAAFLQRQAILDYWALRNYHAPTAIANLATQTTMNDGARKVFYVNAPEIVDKATFTTKCPSALREKTIVLGCYHGNQNGIYLLKVDDPRLNGVVQVTAAHELLHAYYDRLSSSERTRIDGLLMDYYKNKLTDERIKETIEGYKISEPNDVVNEMHSIFATEIADLPAELETYYKQYFNNRKQVVAFSMQYEAEFSSRRAAIAADDTKLVELKKQIENLEQRLKDQQLDIARRQNELVLQENRGDINAYNAGVPGFNAVVNEYNAGVRQVQNLVQSYNQLVAERNKLAAEISELSNALTSNVTTINN